MAVRAPAHSSLVRHEESVAAQEAGEGRGGEGRGQECKHVRIQAQNPTRPGYLTSKIQFLPERLISRWSSSKMLYASDIRLDAIGVSNVHAIFPEGKTGSWLQRENIG